MSSEEPDRQGDQARNVDLTPHPLLRAQELQVDEGLSTLVGFIGPSKAHDRVRIYLDLSFTSYCEVETADIVQTAPVDAGDDNSPTVVWLESSARVGLVSVDRLAGDANYISGAIRRRYQGRATREPVPADKVSDAICTVFCPPKTKEPGTSWECYPSEECTSSGIFC